MFIHSFIYSFILYLNHWILDIFNDVVGTIEKQNRCKNVISNRNNDHNHRANNQNGYINTIIDKKQYERIPTNGKIIRKCKLTWQNTNKSEVRKRRMADNHTSLNVHCKMFQVNGALKLKAVFSQMYVYPGNFEHYTNTRAFSLVTGWLVIIGLKKMLACCHVFL